MDDRIEALDRSRRRMLAGFLVALVAWQVPTIVQEAAGASMPDPVVGALAAVAALAGIVWIGYAVQLVRLQRAVARDPEAASALDDERVREVRNRAFVFGFWFLIVFLAAARLAAFAVVLPAGPVVQAALVGAAAAAIGAFLVLDRA